MGEFKIFTDGACSKNPGPGGYAFTIIYNDRILLKMSGCKQMTTNNEMELTAIVQSLKHLAAIHPNVETFVNIHSDSAYCVNSIEQKWVGYWKNNNWKTKKGEDIKNKELWEEMHKFLKNKKLHIKMVKVKGHSGDKYNELVDGAAKRAIKRLNVQSDISKQKGVQ